MTERTEPATFDESDFKDSDIPHESIIPFSPHTEYDEGEDFAPSSSSAEAQAAALAQLQAKAPELQKAAVEKNPYYNYVSTAVSVPEYISEIPKRRSNRLLTKGDNIALNLSGDRRKRLLEAYRGASKEKSPYLVNARKPKAEPLTYDEKLALGEKKRKEVLDRLQKYFPGEDPSTLLYQARRANALDLKAQREANKAKKPKKEPTEDEKKLILAHMKKPNIMTDPRYNPALLAYQGKSYIPTSYAKDWKKFVPQTMPSDEYDRMVDNFSEMVGVANMRPEFDKRLLTKKSAEKVYGKDGKTHIYTLLDMDDDPNTPGILKITRKGYATKEGKIIIPPRVVAIGGYKIPDATAHQTEKLLKNIAYYDNVPDAKARKALKFGKFLEETVPFKGIIAEKKANMKSTGLTQVTKYVKDYLQRNDYQVPSNGSSVYITLCTIDNGNNYTYHLVYTVNSVVWNTIIARFTKFFAYHFVFPRVNQTLDELKIMDESVANNDRIKAFQSLTLHKIPDILNPQWNKMFMDPAVENAVLRDPNIQEAIAQICSQKKTQLALDEHLYNFATRILTIICKYTMNINPTLVNMILMGVGQDPSAYVVTFTRKTWVENIEKELGAGKLIAQPMTPIKKETVVEKAAIEYTGKEYIDPNYVPPRLL